MKTLNKFLNSENTSKIKWFKNYCFAGTLFIVVLTCLCYFAFDTQLAVIAGDTPSLNILLKAFRHSNGMHLFGNMISLLWLGLFFENKIGSLRFVALFFAFVFIGNGICAIYYNSIGYEPFSGVGGSSANYALFGFIFIALCFNFKKYFFNGEDVSFNRILLALIIFFFPVLLVLTGASNPNHIYPIIAGIVVWVMFFMTVFIWRKTKTKNTKIKIE